MKTKNKDKSIVLTTEMAKPQYDWSDFLSILPNPDSILREKGKASEVFQELLNDGHLFGIVCRRKAGTLSLEWDVEKNNANDNYFESIKSVFESIEIDTLIENILDAPLYGFRPIEILWENTDGMWKPSKFLAKPLEWFGFGKNSELMFINDSFNYEECPKFKFLCPKNSADYSNPYGTAILSKCFWNVFFKRNNMQFWAVFTEKFGMPWVIAKYAANVTDQDKVDEFVDALNNMVQDAVIALPADADANFFSPSGSSPDSYIKLAHACTVENSILILGHASSSEATPGKLGAEDSAISATDDIVDSDKKLVKKTLNELIRIIYEVNGWTGDYPLFYFFEEEDINKDLAERNEILIRSGQVKQFSKPYIMRTFGLEEDDFEVNDGTENTPEPTALEKKSSIKLNRLKSIYNLNFMNEEVATDQITLDEFVDELINPKFADGMMNELLQPIFNEVAKSEDLNKLLKNYSKLYSKLNINELYNQLVIASLSSHCLGFSSDDKSKGVKNSNELGLDDLIHALDLEPEEAIEYFKNLGIEVSEDWESTLELIKKQIFTISGVTKLEVLKDYKDMLQKALDEGLSAYEFKKNLKEKFTKKGWYSREKGEAILPSYRLDTIYRTNLQSAMMQGRWEQQKATADLLPYLQHFSSIDGSTTKSCNELHLKVFRKDDKFHAKYLRPPGHFRCRRRMTSLTENQVKKLGLTVLVGSENPSWANQKGFEKSDEGFDYKPDLKKYPQELVKEFNKEQKR